MSALNRIYKLIGHLNHNKCDRNTDDNFKYTPGNGGILTREQRQFYEDNGYVVIKGLLNKQEILKYYRRFDELVENPSERPPKLIYMYLFTLNKS